MSALIHLACGKLSRLQDFCNLKSAYNLRIWKKTINNNMLMTKKCQNPDCNWNLDLQSENLAKISYLLRLLEDNPDCRITPILIVYELALRLRLRQFVYGNLGHEVQHCSTKYHSH